MIISARVSRRDHSSYVLHVRTKPVGWLRTGALGICGFDDEEQARRASATAARTLEQWYQARWRSATPIPWDDEGQGDGVLAGRTVVGRVVSPCPIPDADGDTHGFELRVPDQLWVATGLELAQRIFTALDEAGLSPMGRPDLLPAS